MNIRVEELLNEEIEMHGKEMLYPDGDVYVDGYLDGERYPDGYLDGERYRDGYGDKSEP